MRHPRKPAHSLTQAVAARLARRKVAVLETNLQSNASKWTHRRDADMPWVVQMRAARLGAQSAIALGKAADQSAMSTNLQAVSSR
jgi:hypothetical protein